MKALLIALVVWLVLIVVAASLGGLMSFYTGNETEIPKWNGWSYFFFSVREIGTLAALVTFPIALIVFLALWGVATRGDDAKPHAYDALGRRIKEER